MPAPIPPRRALLGARLRALRAIRYRSGSALARALDWPQTKVSKIERGAQLPSQADLTAWVEAAGAGRRDRGPSCRRCSGRPDWTTGYGTTPGGCRVGSRPRRTRSRTWTWQQSASPSTSLRWCPDSCRPPAYAREVLTAAGGASVLGGAEGRVTERITAQLRRQQVLYMPGKIIQLVVGEAALRTTFGERATLTGPLDRLLQVVPNMAVAALA